MVIRNSKTVASRVRRRTVMQARILQPRYIVPFASFIWFCHEENAYMNSGISPIDKVFDAIRDQSNAEPIILYPGDHWRIGASHDSRRAIERYLADLDSVSQRPLKVAQAVDPEELVSASREFCDKVCGDAGPTRVLLGIAKKQYARDRERYGFSLASLLRSCLLQVHQPRIYVRDHEESYAFTIRHGLRKVNCPAADCDIETGAESLHYAFKHMWGGQTLLINGRFREMRHDSRLELFDYFHLAGTVNAGKMTGWGDMLRNMALRVPVLSRMIGQTTRA